MTINALYWLFYRDIKDVYPNLYALVGSAFGTFLNLAIYWYTAKAIGPSFFAQIAGQPIDYFTYIVWGEILLIVPFLFFDGISTSFRSYASEGVWDSLLVTPKRPQTSIILIGISRLPRDLIRLFFTFLFGALFFDFKFSFLSFNVLVFVIAAIPAFLGLGLIGTALLIRFGRGKSVIAHFTSIAAVLSGALFPLTVFPEFIHNNLSLLFPFASYLEGARSVIDGTWTDLAVKQLWILLAWGLLCFPVGYLAVGQSIEERRKSGMPLIFV